MLGGRGFRTLLQLAKRKRYSHCFMPACPFRPSKHLARLHECSLSVTGSGNDLKNLNSLSQRFSAHTYKFLYLARAGACLVEFKCTKCSKVFLKFYKSFWEQRSSAAKMAISCASLYTIASQKSHGLINKSSGLKRRQSTK